MFIGGTFTFLLAPKIIGIYSPAPDLYVLTILVTRISICFFLFFGVTNVIQGFLQAMHSPNYSLFISLARVFLFISPLLIVISKISTELVWWGFVIGEFLAMLVSLIMYRSIYKKKIKIMNCN